MHRILILLCILLAGSSFAQQGEFWLIDEQTQTTKKIQDSLEAVKYLDSLVDSGFYFTRLKSVEKENTITKIIFDKGKNYSSGYVQLDDSLAQKLNVKNELFVKKIDSLKQRINNYFKDKGYTFNRVQSRYLGMRDNYPLVHLSVLPVEKRTIDGFQIKEYERIPKRFVKNLEREFLHQPYTSLTIRKISEATKNHPFITEKRSPQTLFTRDSTTVFLYLNKRKTSTFDGVIGFGSDDAGKFQVNGTLNVSLQNMFNGFEKIELYWQRNPDKGQTFNLQADLPYLFQSNIGFNGTMSIYRQDTLYANVKFSPSIYYNFSLRQKLGLRANFEISSVLSDSYFSGEDYNKKGLGLWYEYTVPTDVDLFVHRSKFRVEGDLLSVHYGENNGTQNAYFLSAEHNFHLSGSHFLNVRGESALLSSKTKIFENELLRFGGWNSMRGFNEKSLLADFYVFGGAEYRYLIGEEAFFDSFFQLATLHNSFADLNSQMYSFGLGFNYRLPIGVMSFQISTGNAFGTPIRFRDTKVHWGLVTKF